MAGQAAPRLLKRSDCPIRPDDGHFSPIEFERKLGLAQPRVSETGSKEGKALATLKENLAELRTRAAAFTEKRLPLLQQLGIA